MIKKIINLIKYDFIKIPFDIRNIIIEYIEKKEYKYDEYDD